MGKYRKENPNNLFYLKAPTHFSYFMNRGLILKNTSNNPIMKNMEGYVLSLILVKKY